MLAAIMTSVRAQLWQRMSKAIKGKLLARRGAPAKLAASLNKAARTSQLKIRQLTRRFAEQASSRPFAAVRPLSACTISKTQTAQNLLRR